MWESQVFAKISARNDVFIQDNVIGVAYTRYALWIF